MGLTLRCRRFASSVREILSGRTDGASDVARAIGQPPGAPGWFTPDDPIWTVHGSVATFLGGIRSLLFQTLHPLALAGVDRHSSYREDPFGRLQRTGAFIAATTYGSAGRPGRPDDPGDPVHAQAGQRVAPTVGRIPHRTPVCSPGCTSP